MIDCLTYKHKSQADNTIRAPSSISYVGDYHVGIVLTINENEGFVMGWIMSYGFLSISKNKIKCCRDFYAVVNNVGIAT